MPDEVRAQTVSDAATKEKKSFWEYLNTPFILFLLSSVVISGVSFLYQQHETRSHIIEQDRKQISKLKTEVKYRLDVMSYIDETTFNYTSLFSAHGALLGDIGNKNPDNVLIGEYSPIYPEFQNRTIISLLWELQDFQREKNKSYSLRNAINTARRLAIIWNDDTELQEEVKPGKHDSIWRFNTGDYRREFSDGIRSIRTLVVEPDDQ